MNSKYVRAKLIKARVMQLSATENPILFIRIQDYPHLRHFENGLIHEIARLEYEQGLLKYMQHVFSD